MPRTRLPFSLFGLLAAMVVPGASAAPPPPNEVPYVASFSGGRIDRINTDGTSTTIVSGIQDLSSLLARREVGGEISLVACAKQVFFYENVTSPTFDGTGAILADLRCNGITRNPNGDLFFVLSGPGNGRGVPKQVWMIPTGGAGPGGYGTPVLIDGNLRADSLEHVAIARSADGDLEADDLLVLTGGRSARVVLYRKNGGAYGKIDDAFISFPTADDPRGLAFVRGKLLVSLVGGQIKSFDGNGVERPLFASGFGNGLWKLEPANQDGVYKVLVTLRNSHSLLAITVGSDGAGNPIGGTVALVSEDLAFPEDVAVAQDLTWIPASDSFVASFNSQDVTYRRVGVGATAEQTCSLTSRQDPRESECPNDCSGTCDAEGFCRRDLDATEIGLPHPGLTIPGHVRSLKIGDPDTGVPRFFACVATAPDFGLAEHFVHEDQFLNWHSRGPTEPACDDTDTSKRAIFFRGTIPGEPPVVEGNRMVPYPTGCVPDSSNRGDVDDYSVLFPAARLLLAFCKVADDDLSNLLGAIDQHAAFIEDGVEAQLRSRRAAAAGAYNRYKNGDPQGQVVAMSMLDAFIAIVEGNPGAFNNTGAGRNVSGELIVRARSAKYVISQVTLPVPLAECPIVLTDRRH
jgi:hypothetical protein